MSKKSTASPLLIRHRYLNPFPPPPFPPKLLLIPTDPARYAGYRLLAHLENERETPVLADGDLGMSIELGLESDGTYGLGAYWEGDQTVVCPDPTKARIELDPEDAALLVDPPPVQGASVSNINGLGQNPTVSTVHSTPLKGSPLFTNHSSASARKADVTWLRRTEYFNEAHPKSREGSASKTRQQLPTAPKTKSDRLADIHASFDAIAEQSIDTLRHPTKPHLKAVDSYPCLPNDSIWANTCDFYRFQEDPTDRKAALSTSTPQPADPRLDFAILRPVPPIHNDSRLAYYLPDTVEGALHYKKLKLETKNIDQGVPDPTPDPTDEENDQTHNLHFVREYEVNQQRDLNQYLLVFDDGDSGRPKAAYYNPVAQSRTLRKRRPRMQGQRPVDDLGNPLWDGMNVKLADDAEAIELAREPREVLLSAVREPPPELQDTI